MATNKLMEAAAEILASSKSKAGAMPPEKLPAEIHDAGGPTPQNYKNDDNSAKITPSTKSATAPTTKSSDASPDKQEMLGGGKKTMKEEEVQDDEVIAEIHGDEVELEEELNLEDYSLEELEIFMESEEFQQIDEISQNTVASYLTKKRSGYTKSIKGKSDTTKRKYEKEYKADIEPALKRKSAYDAGASGKWYNNKRSDYKGVVKKYYDKGEALNNAIKSATKKHNAAMSNLKKKSMKEDVDAIFADDSTISEEFKEKVSTIFEARVEDRVAQIQEEVEAKYAGMLEEAIAEMSQDLTEKVDDYLNYVVEQWMQDNELAIESGLRSELSEEFIAGLRNLFAEHYINVPEDKVDLVDELAGKVEELESKLDEEIERGISYAKALVESRKNDITRDVCEGLTTTQVEKIKSLAESVEFSTEDEYKTKLETIRENYFPSGAKKATEDQLHEQVEETTNNVAINDPFVAAVSKAISKTKL
jgi:hypothetical protein